MRKFWNITLDGKVAKVHIDGQIGDNWFGEGVTSKSFKEDVDALGNVSDIHVHISSVGGNVLDGLAMYHYLKQHPANISTFCDSLAASIASVVFLAGDKDKRFMPKGTELFVHDPLTWAMGNAKTFRKTADELDEKKDSILDIYETETGLKREEISDLMTNETTLSADEAVNKGFAHEVLEYDNPVVNSVNINEVKQSVIMSTELDHSKVQITNLTTKLAEANETIAQLSAPPEAMEADQVITMCKDSGFEGLAVDFIQAKLPQAELEQSLNQAAEVQDLCAAVGIEHGDVVALIRDPVAMVKTALNLHASLYGDDVNHHVSPDVLNKGNGTVPSVTDIYAKRKQQVTN